MPDFDPDELRRENERLKMLCEAYEQGTQQSHVVRDLVAQRDAFARLWLKHEWMWIEEVGDTACLECHEGRDLEVVGDTRGSHAPDCALDAAFKAAGLR